MSAGTPCWICAASWLDAAKEERGPGSICGSTSVSDAAASTVICALRRACAAVTPAATATVRASASVLRSIRRLLALDHDGARLHDRGAAHPRPQPELVDRVPRDDGDHARPLRQLDLAL